MDYAHLEIDRLIDVARREQTAEWYGPAFYSFTPSACDGPNQQCLSFRLEYAAATSADLRASLEEALAQHGCHLDKETVAITDGHFACSAVSHHGTATIKKVRA